MGNSKTDSKKNKNENDINNSMYKSIIKLLDKASPTRSDISLAWIRAKKLDKGLIWTVWRPQHVRNEYLTKSIAKVTKAFLVSF